MATLQELETFWSIDDCLRAVAILDMQLDIRKSNEKKVNNGNR